MQALRRLRPGENHTDFQLAGTVCLWTSHTLLDAHLLRGKVKEMMCMVVGKYGEDQ